MSIYEVSFNYTSKQSVCIEVLLLSATRHLLSKSTKISDLKIGSNSASILIPTDGFIPNLPQCVLYINPLNINIGGQLTGPLVTRDAIENAFIVDETSIKIQKVFDIRGYLENTTFGGINTKSGILRRSPGLIFAGYYLREDGLGAHLPNLVENVFYNYENISFIRMPGRAQLNFYFLNSIKDFSKKNLENYKKDFKWMKFWYSTVNKYQATPQLYHNGKYLHVGGIDINPIEFQKEIANVQFLKSKFNIESYYYLMWESTGIEVMKDLLMSFDNIVVTNEWLRMLIMEKLGHPKVHVVEHIAKFYSKKRQDSSDTYTFGYSGGLWDRKNVDKVVIAFQQLGNKQYKLKIHSRDFVNTGPMVDKIKNLVGENSLIDIKNKTLSDNDYAEWWAAINCLVFVSSGEGYSIQPRQALSMGIPVILSKNTSHLDLINIPGIVWVESSTEERAYFSGMPGANINVGNHFAVKIEDIKKAMYEMIDNYSHYKREAQKAITIIKEKTNSETIKQQWERILKI